LRAWVAGALFLTISTCGFVFSHAEEAASSAQADAWISQPSAIPGVGSRAQPILPPLAAVLEKARNDPYLYGLYSWNGEYQSYRDSIRKVGWRSIKLGGPLDDATMRMLVEDDLQVIKQTGGSPENGNRAKPDANPAGDAAFISNYTAYLGAFIDRYGSNGAFFKENPGLPYRPIHYVEIWNEPNFQYLITPDNRPYEPQEADRQALYAKILPAAYSTLKAHDKDVTVVGFGAGGGNAGDMRFIDHVHKLNPEIARSYDILSTHPYVDPGPPEYYKKESWGSYSIASSLDCIRKTMESNGRADAPVWYTECGWGVSKKDGGEYEEPADRVVPPEFQAAYICRMYAYSLRLGVDHTMIMFVKDADYFNGGFFQRDGTWRLSSYAVQNMIHQLPEPKLIGAISDGAEGYFAYRFSPKADPQAPPVIMAWNVDGPKSVHIPTKASIATIVDMMGHSRTVSSKNGELSLEIGPLPVYVEEISP
jgi:hypothetical protein